MKRRINARLVQIAVIASVATMICITYVCYGIFQDRIKRDLQTESRLLTVTGFESLIENEALEGDQEIRITWIDGNGKVIFDNDVDEKGLNNHMNRPEVKDAFEKGHGESVRKSDTLKMKRFYYATLLEDGTVLRVSTEARSIFSVYMSSFTIMAGIILAIVFVCAGISSVLTKQLLLPIEEMANDLGSVPHNAVYEELDPFVNRIREQHENILEAAKSRQDFTANVSHELKTPLTAISGYAELIENQMVDQKTQIKFAGDIRQNATRLLSLITDIIRLSELDHEEIHPNFEVIDLYDVVKERVEFLKQSAKDKNIRIRFYGIHCEVYSNRGMLLELIDNLVQNAIRYNVPQGKVDVTVMKYKSRGTITVADTGIGIPEEDRERIFERFYRVDKSRSRDTGGTGLGLAIVKHIVELHNGEIELTSELGKGTRITVTL